MKKRMMSIVLSILLMICLFPAEVFAAQDTEVDLIAEDEAGPLHSYTDLVGAEEYHDGVHYCVEKGLMQGVAADHFAGTGGAVAFTDAGKCTDGCRNGADRRSKDATEKSILDAIAANAEVEIPQAMIEREIDGLVQRFEYQLPPIHKFERKTTKRGFRT
jgi:hypothetical protein